MAHPNGKRAKILNALVSGPKRNAELCEAADEIGGYLAREMVKLRNAGLVVNLSEPKRRAVYALTPLGHRRVGA